MPSFAIYLKNNSYINETLKSKSVVLPIIQEKPPMSSEKEVVPEHISNIKYIGYEPINVFIQTEPLSYPYVIMPARSKSPIKFPHKGRQGRRGYKEAEFLTYIKSYFKEVFQIYDDRFILTKNNINRYEPDITLIDEKEGVNIFLDVEIDEPYEGINDINKRSVTHYQYSDTKRNNEFSARGWIVIRFAEIQVHQNPNGCCRFIADVIRSIYQEFKYPEKLVSAAVVTPIRQWTKNIAQQWSNQKYREKYLGIDCFGITEDNSILCNDNPTDTDINVEKEVIDEKVTSPLPLPNSKFDIIYEAIRTNKYIAFTTTSEKTVVKPINCSGNELIAYCYIKNKERHFLIDKLSDIIIKDSYYTLRLLSPNLGVEKVANIMNIIIPNQKYVRMKYTRGAWTNTLIVPETGEIIIDKTESETSTRTVSNIRLDTEGWGNNYIKTYCHHREEERTFRFDRISELEILDL